MAEGAQRHLRAHCARLQTREGSAAAQAPPPPNSKRGRRSTLDEYEYEYEHRAAPSSTPIPSSCWIASRSLLTSLSHRPCMPASRGHRGVPMPPPVAKRPQLTSAGLVDEQTGSGRVTAHASPPASTQLLNGPPKAMGARQAAIGARHACRPCGGVHYPLHTAFDAMRQAHADAPRRSRSLCHT